jgi:tryptophan-rich sensory protein
MLAGTLGASLAFALVGAVIVAFAREPWYDNLHQPSWAPPGWAVVVGSVIVHVALGLAGWRLWVRAPGSPPLTLWVVQLALTLGWTVLFFGLWVPRWALFEAAVLALVTATTILAAWPRSRAAAGLMVPNLAWIGLLLTLNGAILTLN